MSIQVQKQGAVTTIVLDRANVRNAVDRATAEALSQAVEDFENDEAASVAVLCGVGNFCAGADLKAIAKGTPNRMEKDGDGPMGPTRRARTKPVIAAISGHAVAGGLELALWCDLRIAESNAVLGVFCRNWGVPLIDGGTVRLPRLIGQSRAMDLILTGRAVHADEAAEMGLVNRVVPPGASRAAAEQLAREIAAFPQACVRADYQSAAEAFDRPAPSALLAEFERALPALAADAIDGAKRFTDAHIRGQGTIETRAVTRNAAPQLSTRLQLRMQLEEVASNLWWVWNPEIQAVFAKIHPQVWQESNHSPTAVLSAASDKDIARALPTASDRSVVSRTVEALRAELNQGNSWCRKIAPTLAEGTVAYFCAEFGIHESVPIYSGGLGVLAGDHIKTTSDLGIPFVGISLKYAEGYFQQSVNAEGWQVESYPTTDWDSTPAYQVRDDHDRPLEILVDFAGRKIHTHVWRIDVGRSKLYLLDTNVEANSPSDREICKSLYGGDDHTRILQEVVLGVGGVRLLRALSIKPSVFHLNEGHSAFACIELLDERIHLGESFTTALGWVRDRTLFTTHTPVPAGHDRFAGPQVTQALSHYHHRLGVSWRTVLGLGRVDPSNDAEPLCMTVLALKCAGCVNGVSLLHQDVSREMWAAIYPGKSATEVPIGHVTNGVHVESFMHPEMRRFMTARFDERWRDALLDNDEWARMIDCITDAELIEIRRTLKRDMFHTFQNRLGREANRPLASASLESLTHWKQDVLTIGFARRFATYKRGDLIFRDRDRAAALFNDADRPLQFVVAGKAHPKDIPGKEVIQRVIQASREPRLEHRVVFLENYDLAIARALVSGVDVWLNNPQRPREASGTSGEKVPFHGGVNASILDGWWAEGYDGKNGYAIGGESVPRDTAIQDSRDQSSLYEVFEKELVPEYYSAGTGGTGAAWIRRVRESMKTLPAQFSTRRMLKDYVTRYYEPIARASQQ